MGQVAGELLLGPQRPRPVRPATDIIIVCGPSPFSLSKHLGPRLIRHCGPPLWASQPHNLATCTKDRSHKGHPRLSTQGINV